MASTTDDELTKRLDFLTTRSRALDRIQTAVLKFRESHREAGGHFCHSGCDDDCDGNPNIDHEDADPGDYDADALTTLNEIAAILESSPSR